MNKIVKLAVIAFVLNVPLALAADNSPGGQQANATAPQYKSKSPKLKRTEIDALLAKPEQLLIIDVRRPDELTSNGGFPVYVSIQATDLEHRLAFIPKDRTIITVSNHAARAGVAADFLTDHGFKVAGAVGVLDYAAEGGSILKVVAPAPKN